MNRHVSLDGSKDLTFIGAGDDRTIIGPETYHSTFDVEGFRSWAGTSTLRLERLRIEHISGYAIRVYNASVELVDCTIEQCRNGLHAWSPGGHVYVDGCRFVDSMVLAVPNAVYARDAELRVTNTVFVRYHVGVKMSHGTGLISNCTFTGDQLAAIAIILNGVSAAVESCTITGMRVHGISLDRVGDMSVRNCLIESCLGDGIAIGGSSTFIDIQECIVRDCGSCMFVGGESAQLAIHGNHFLRDEASGGWYVKTPAHFSWGPAYFDLTENYWGTTDIPTIAEWILDGHDQPHCLLYIVFEPIAGSPVPVRQQSWTAVKGQFRD